MRCSWRTVELLVCLLLVTYVAIHTLQDLFPVSSARQKKSDDPIWKPSSSSFTAFTRKHIHLLSQTRSGSSFAGQLLNQHPEIFYMFEPLYHVHDTFSKFCERPLNKTLYGAFRDLLFHLYTCDLTFLENYIVPKPQNHLTSSFFRWSSSYALCSPPVCQEGKMEITAGEPDELWCQHECKTLNLTLASLACQARSHVAIKTVRMPEISELRTLIEDPRLDLRIIHLVRDPRAILASRMTAFSDLFMDWKIWNDTEQQPHFVDFTMITDSCESMASSAELGLQKPAWLRGRYLLVRYEDLALNPEAKAGEIYKFLDLDVDSKVLTWISKNTNSTSPTKISRKYSTRRVSKDTVESWRLHLAYDIVRTVESLCNKTLDLLGYKMVQSEAELRDMTKSLVEPITF